MTKKEVSKVTVLEKNKEVIDYHKFINPKLFDDVEVIHFNAYDYKGKCDTLLLDHYEDEAGNAKLETAPKKLLMTCLYYRLLQKYQITLSVIECGCGLFNS